ncbi:hypothetical protein Fcan01_15573 [Folsomia candida]|uniref:Uncharacterized protein n=1 Tax=Folsomia candida TaxID=158441 RepID=A0A226DXL6_FOLCA|nr:hypothetical protein Fcan01_15573 [Folsomia candida]
MGVEFASSARNAGCIDMDHIISKFQPNRRVTLYTIALTVQCKTAEYASIPYLLARSEYCQVQIIYDKIGDDVLQPVCSSNFHPLTLIQYYFPGNVTLRQPWNSLWMSIATNYFKQSKSDYFSHQNVYTILVSAIQKSKLNKIFEYPRISSLATDPLLDNFGILLLARNRTFNLCVQRVGTWSEKISTMECKQSENGNIVTLFENLLSSPILWKLDSLSDIGIEVVFSLYKKFINISSYEAFCPWSFVLANIFEEAGYSLEINKTAINDEIVRCGKSVLISKAVEMGLKFDEMSRKYFWRKFYKGKDILNYVLVGWTFAGEGNSKVPQYFQSLYESGIQGRLDLEVAMRKHSRHSEYTILKLEDDPVRLGGTIMTLFMLCGILISATMLVG